MKFIKLDGRHTLYKRGYRYAYVFKDYKNHNRLLTEYQIAEIIRTAEGLNWFDHTSYGKAVGGRRRPYYIGFNKESTHTLVQLQM